MSDDAVDYGGKVISSESDVLSVMSGHTSNAASEGCHSIAQLIMSDLQTSMGGDILQMIVCLRVRDGKEAVEQLPVRAMYPEEANNVALDIKTTSKLVELKLVLQHQGLQRSVSGTVAASAS